MSPISFRFAISREKCVKNMTSKQRVKNWFDSLFRKKSKKINKMSFQCFNYKHTSSMRRPKSANRISHRISSSQIAVHFLYFEILFIQFYWEYKKSPSDAQGQDYLFKAFMDRIFKVHQHTKAITSIMLLSVIRTTWALYHFLLPWYWAMQSSPTFQSRSYGCTFDVEYSACKVFAMNRNTWSPWIIIRDTVFRDIKTNLQAQPLSSRNAVESWHQVLKPIHNTSSIFGQLASKSAINFFHGFSYLHV